MNLAFYLYCGTSCILIAQYAHKMRDFPSKVGTGMLSTGFFSAIIAGCIEMPKHSECAIFTSLATLGSISIGSILCTTLLYMFKHPYQGYLQIWSSGVIASAVTGTTCILGGGVFVGLRQAGINDFFGCTEFAQDGNNYKNIFILSSTGVGILSATMVSMIATYDLLNRIFRDRPILY